MKVGAHDRAASGAFGAYLVREPGSPPSPDTCSDSTEVSPAPASIVERQVKAFVAQIATKPYDSSLARWQTVVPMCPLVAGLSREVREKLRRVRPRSIGQASRIPGVTPAAVSILMVHARAQSPRPRGGQHNGCVKESG